MGADEAIDSLNVLLVLDFFVEVEEEIGLVGEALIEVELETLRRDACTFLSYFSGDLREESRLTVTMLLWYSFFRNS
jgi:hypothetical protein